MDKTVASAAEAIADIPSGATLAVGGFGVCGVPQELIDALHEQGAGDLRVVSNNCGTDDHGLGILLRAGRISRVTGSYVGENKEFARQYLSGELELELVPQGTLAERLRAGGAGIPAFYTPAGVGTAVAEGGVPWRYAADGSVAVESPAKETRVLDGETYVLERSISTDFALVRASKGDRHGNLVFDRTTANFNPLCATAGRVTVAEVEELVEPGEIAPEHVHLPGIFVQRVVEVRKRGAKPVEKRTVREGSAV
ncbi:CoA transferase subunit A [Streptomyces sp. M2CJ-2]|uniref:CoA transferase subunit A n=1 Tax=Streptomyces sp. M2CJ-2 TaxID=2803948 RepID=UPI0019278569|nr:CoA transferase subunit A [Streptomyces sp. M2CJ-2]MBL3668026.1 CoA transferase subunit A [Streptomyces sp. M2CJ-2]